MDSGINNFDTSLPRIHNLDMITTNHSSFLQSVIWNETDASIVLFHHPMLYCIAIYALFLIIVGTIGNILTIIILLRPKLRKQTTMRYLIAVAVADLCALYSWDFNLFYKHLINPYQNDLEDFSIIPCRIISFIGFVSLQLSSWYLTLVSLDRCLNIHLLVLHQRVEQTNRAVYIIVSVAIIIGLINSHLLFLNGYQQPNCIPFEKRTCFICYSRLNDPYYIFPKWEQIHVILYNVIPFSIMLISNYFIIRRSVPSNIQRTSSSIQRTSSNDYSSKCNANYRQYKQKKLTQLLLFVTFVFVLLTTPVMIYNVFLRNYLVSKKPLKYIIHGILLCIQYTSHAINFFIYCFGASIFRHELNEFCTNCLLKTKNNRWTTTNGRVLF